MTPWTEFVHVLFFFKDFIYFIYLERGKGRGKEREGNIDV